MNMNGYEVALEQQEQLRNRLKYLISLGIKGKVFYDGFFTSGGFTLYLQGKRNLSKEVYEKLLVRVEQFSKL